MSTGLFLFHGAGALAHFGKYFVDRRLPVLQDSGVAAGQLVGMLLGFYVELPNPPLALGDFRFERANFRGVSVVALGADEAVKPREHLARFRVGLVP